MRARVSPHLNGHSRNDDLQLVPLMKSVSSAVAATRALMSKSVGYPDIEDVFANIAKDIQEAGGLRD